MNNQDYNPSELMICSASRLMEDHSTAFIGTGLPMLAGALAQKMHAPDLVSIFEFGGTGAILEDLPLAVGERRSFHKALAASGILDIVETAQRGFVDYGFLGGAQIDPYGNLNSTVIGDHDHPKVRLPGSGGGNDVGSHCWRTIAIMKHDKLRFVEKVDFISSVGYLNGGDSREREGLLPKKAIKVYSNLAALDFEEKTKQMRLVSVHPGVTVERVKQNTGFDLVIPGKVPETERPTEQEVDMIRNKIDAHGIYLTVKD